MILAGEYVAGRLKAPRLVQDGPGWHTPTPPLSLCDAAIVLGRVGGSSNKTHTSIACRTYGCQWEFGARWTGEDIEIAVCQRCGSQQFLSGRPTEFEQMKDEV